MKVVTVLGSPRKEANSSKIAENVVKSLGSGVEEKKFFLNEMNVRGCQSCYSCKGKTETCVLKDDLIKVLGAIVDADLLIFTSPIYIGEITGQAKLFIDRTYAFYKPDFITSSEPSRLPPGKKAILIFTQGNPDVNTYQKNVHDNYVGYFKSHGFKPIDIAAHIPYDPDGEKKAVETYSAEIIEKLKTV